MELITGARKMEILQWDLDRGINANRGGGMRLEWGILSPNSSHANHYPSAESQSGRLHPSKYFLSLVFHSVPGPVLAAGERDKTTCTSLSLWPARWSFCIDMANPNFPVHGPCYL